MQMTRRSDSPKRSDFTYRSAIALAAALALVAPTSVTCAAELLSFGVNSYGNLGNGASGAGANSNVPVSVIGMTSGVSAVASGGAHSLAVKDGALYAWGLNYFGALGDGVTGSGGVITFDPIAHASLTLSSGVTAVAATQYASAAIVNGGIYTFGANSMYALANGTPNGSLSPTPTPVINLNSGVTAIAGGQAHFLAIQNGALYAFGWNRSGQLGNGTNGDSTNAPIPLLVPGMESGVTATDAGELHSLAIKNGTVYGWGYNLYGSIGDGTGGNFKTTPQAVTTLPAGATDVAAGSNHSLALVGGVVYAWGRNLAGELGDGDYEESDVPVAVTGITGPIVNVEAGLTSSYALGVDGSLWTWGSNKLGQLGTGSTADSAATPQHLLPAAGYRFSDINVDYSQHVLVTRLALPVYFKGTTGNGLNDVGNYATTVAGTSVAPIAPVESTDIYFGTANATVANLSVSTGAGLLANSLTFGTGVSTANPVTISGTGTLSLGADKNVYAYGTGIVVQSGAAAVTINAPVALLRNQSWTNNSTAPLVVNGAVGGSSGLIKAGNGTLALNGANTYTGVTTVTGGTLVAAPAARTVLLGGTGTVGGTDIKNGTVVLTGGDAAAIRGLLGTGYGNGFSSGTLRSSTATFARGLGYKADGTAVTVRATLYGDADLDGGVSINDFNALAGNFGQSGKVWVDGDFDYDGGVSINDFNLLAGNFGQTLPASAESWAGLLAFAAAHNDLAAFAAVTGVPEPTSLGVVAAGVAMGLRRRRRAS